MENGINMSDNQPDPFKQLIPHRLDGSFTEPSRLLGVETKLFQLNVFIGMIVILMAQFIWWLIAMVVFHFILQWVTKREPRMREIYLKYQFQGDRYEPWGGIPPKNNKRPTGFGRNESC